MIKYSLLLLNFFGLFGLHLLFDDGVVIEDDTPTSLSPNGSAVVTVRVMKGDIEGFAKLELIMPEGLIAEVVEANQASFTFANQKAKFIWMTLPKEQEFSVSYRLHALPGASGNLVVKGTFSYIKENQRVDYSLQSKLISIVSESESTANDVTDAPHNESQTDGGMACVREIDQISSREYLVSLKVVNANLKGFVKLMEYIPVGFSVSEEDSDGAITTIENDGIKYVWFEAPDLTEFEVVYRLTADASVGDPELHGSFSFVENNSPREKAIVDGHFIQNLSDNTEDESEYQQAKQDGEDDLAVTDVKKDESREVVAIPDPETGVTYKVQILAGHNTVGKSYFKKRHNYSGAFAIENHEGWVKYTTGKYDVYKKSRDARERIKSGYNFPGPFVTAYNEGIRITVQEALMITNQKWYQ